MDPITLTAPTTDSNQQVTQSDGDGRTLSGIGTTPEKLAEVMERHAPVEEPAPTGTPGEAPPVQKQSRGKERFSELTRKRKEAEERAAGLERQLNELRGTTAPTTPAALPSASTPPPGSPPAQFVQPAPSQGRPQPSEDDIGTKYKTYADFVLDSARWVAEQEAPSLDARIRQSIEADRATRDFLTHAESTWAKGRKVYADFDTVRTTAGCPGAHGSREIHRSLHHPRLSTCSTSSRKTRWPRLAQMGDIELAMMASFAPPVGPEIWPRPRLAVQPRACPNAASGVKQQQPRVVADAHQGNAAYKARRAETQPDPSVRAAAR